MAGERTVAYWDAGIFISQITQADDPEDLDGIAYYGEEFSAGRCTPVTSVVTRVEVLDGKLRPENAERFRAFLDRPDVCLASVNTAIADLAHTIRNFYAALADGLGPVGTADAIHLATAIVMKCDVFLTLDGKDGRKRRDRPLLPLSPVIAGRYNLVVRPPRRPPLPLWRGKVS